MLGKPVGRAATLMVVAAVGANSDWAMLVTASSGSVTVASIERDVSTGARARDVSLRMNERPGSTTMELGLDDGAELGTSLSTSEGLLLPLGKTIELLGRPEGVTDPEGTGGSDEGSAEPEGSGGG